MTGRERVLATLDGRSADHMALMPITMMFAAGTLGIKYERYAREHTAMADAQVKTAEMFGFDHVSAIGPPAPESADLGARVEWFTDQPPAMPEANALLAEKHEFEQVRTRGPVAGERIENRIRGIERMRSLVGKELIVEGWVSGPCAAAADLRGINRLMMDFYDDPGLVHSLLDFALETGICFAAAQVDAGADIVGIGDAVASIVGPRIYDEFIQAREKKLVDAIHEKGARARLHICGNIRRILDKVRTLGCDLIDIDSPVPMDEARSILGAQQSLSGNLDPVRALRDSSPEAVRHNLENVRQQAGGRWIVAAGCEIPRETPKENVLAMTRFAQSRTQMGNEIS
ncbi:MAG: uroporphyrinogen decarboxylase family protein [Terracidiphilus sp.]